MLGWEGGLEQIHRVTVLIPLSVMGRDSHFPRTPFLWDAAGREQSWTRWLLPGRTEPVGAVVAVGTGIALTGFEPGTPCPPQHQHGCWGGGLVAYP